MIAEGNNEIFQLYSDYIMEADDFYSQNSVSDITAAHLKTLLLSFEKVLSRTRGSPEAKYVDCEPFC